MQVTTCMQVRTCTRCATRQEQSQHKFGTWEVMDDPKYNRRRSCNECGFIEQQWNDPDPPYDSTSQDDDETVTDGSRTYSNYHEWLGADVNNRR